MRMREIILKSKMADMTSYARGCSLHVRVTSTSGTSGVEDEEEEEGEEEEGDVSLAEPPEAVV